jgi:triacylglycerol lipase
MKELYERILKAKYIHLDGDASYSTEREGDTLYIYFEWSNGKTDWKNNFDFPAKPYRDMQHKWYAHRGFLRVWKAIEPHLQEQINDASINRFIIGGYSHGAAVALLCHEYCKFNRPDAVTVGYGYGSPRVVWGFVRKAVKKRFEGFTVIRNSCDIVTRVPPVWLGYRHAGKVEHIGKGAKYNAIEAHYSENYIAELAIKKV